MTARSIAATALLAALLAGCGGSSGAPTTADADEAVRAATQVLLDAEGFEAIGTYEASDLFAARTEWLDARAGGDHVAVIVVDGEPAAAIVRIGEDDYLATAADAWSATPEAATDGPAYPLRFDLAALAESGLDLFGEDDAGEVERVEMDDGGTAWTYRLPVPERDDTAVLTFEVDPGGHLRQLGIDTETGGLEIAQAVTFQFTVLDDPPPLTAPQPGTALDLEALGYPGGLAGP